MKILIVSRSYQTGGAAIVAQRLLKALRQRPDCQVRLLVLTDDIPPEERVDDVQVYGRSGLEHLWNTVLERAELFVANGFVRSRVFQIDTARHGYRLDRHPWVAWADVVHLHWINQGALSLAAIRGMARQGKRIVWTLHDMWTMTGLCHYAYDCREFHRQCRRCPHLSRLPWLRGTARRSLERKRRLYDESDIRFVCIGSWVMQHARQSTLLADRPLYAIPNPHPIHLYHPQRRQADGEIVVALGAARLDDYVKGFDLFLEVSQHLAEEYPALSERVRWLLYGALRNQTLLAGIRQRYEYLGLQNAEGVRDVLEQADICLCPSRFETLPNSLIESAAAGCWLISFDAGGQTDVLQDGVNGYTAKAYDTRSMAACVARAAGELSTELRQRQHDEMARRYTDSVIAEQYMQVYREK